MKLSIFVPLTVFLSFSAAELAGPSEVASANEDISACLNQCLTEAAVVAGCVSQYDTKCTCPSTAFKDALGQCLTDACTPADQEAAGALHEERCGTPSD